MGTLGAHTHLFSWRENCLWFAAVCAREPVLKKTSDPVSGGPPVGVAPSLGVLGHVCIHISREGALCLAFVLSRPWWGAVSVAHPHRRAQPTGSKAHPSGNTVTRTPE